MKRSPNGKTDNGEKTSNAAASEQDSVNSASIRPSERIGGARRALGWRRFHSGQVRPKGSGMRGGGRAERRNAVIRLIASDMDGTLLDEHSQVPPETFDLIRELETKGVRFVAASGRRYDTLRDFFEPVADRMDFVASNGAQVYVRGRLVDREVFSHAALRRLFALVQRFDCLHMVVFDRTNSYLLDDPAFFSAEYDKDLPNRVVTDRLPSPDTSIVKASISCDEAQMDMTYVLTREFEDDFVFAPSGEKWIDVMQRGVSKATGIAQVLSAHGIDASEAMAFGDSMNDYEILRLVGTSCAMGNGRTAVKQVATRVIGTNVERAVQREMRALLESME